MKRAVSLLYAMILLGGCSHDSRHADSSNVPASTTTSYFQVDPATAGTISGTVLWKGPRSARATINMSEDPACVSANKGRVYDDSVVLGKQNQVANAFIYIKSGLEGKVFAPASTAVVIDQRGCWFHPRVLGLQTGQYLNIVNSDPVTHNIHPMAHVNREWNHSQGPGDPPMHQRFLKPEVMIPVKCNIHSWMHAYIGVLDHPYFAVSSSDGSFNIPNLPPGTYTLALWHEKLGTQEQQVTVTAHGTTAVRFDLRAN